MEQAVAKKVKEQETKYYIAYDAIVKKVHIFE